MELRALTIQPGPDELAGKESRRATSEEQDQATAKAEETEEWQYERLAGRISMGRDGHAGSLFRDWHKNYKCRLGTRYPEPAQNTWHDRSNARLSTRQALRNSCRTAGCRAYRVRADFGFEDRTLPIGHSECCFTRCIRRLYS